MIIYLLLISLVASNTQNSAILLAANVKELVRLNWNDGLEAIKGWANVGDITAFRNWTKITPKDKVRVGVYVLPPFLTVGKRYKDGTVDMTGPVTPVFHKLFSGFKHYELYAPKKITLGVDSRLPNGSWTGYSGRLMDTELDIFLGPVFAEEAVLEDFEIFHPICLFQMCFMASKENIQKSSYFNFLSTVETSVWICTALSMLLMILTSAIMDSAKNMSLEKLLACIERYILIYIAAFFCEGSSREAETRTSQMLLFTWLFFIILLSNSLVSQFMAMLTVQHEGDMIYTLEDLANRKDLLPMGLKGSIQEIAFEKSEEPHHQEILRRIKANPKECQLNLPQLFARHTFQSVKDGKGVLFLQEIGIKITMSVSCLDLTGRRQLYIVDEKFYPHFWVSIGRKGLPAWFKDEYNMRVTRIFEAGDVLNVFRQLSRNYWKCEVKEPLREEDIVLKLSHLNSVFYMTLVCCAFAFFVLILEIVVFIVKKTPHNSQIRAF